MDKQTIWLIVGCALFLWGLSFFKKAYRDFVENKNVGTKEKIFLGVLNFLAAFGTKGDSYVFLGAILSAIGLLIIYFSKG